MPDISELKCSREYVDKMSNRLKDNSHGNLSCCWPICPPLLSPMENTADSWGATSNEAVATTESGSYIPRDPVIGVWLLKEFERLLFTVGRDRNLAQDLHTHGTFLPFEPDTGHFGQRY